MSFGVPLVSVEGRLFSIGVSGGSTEMGGGSSGTALSEVDDAVEWRSLSLVS